MRTVKRRQNRFISVLFPFYFIKFQFFVICNLINKSLTFLATFVLIRSFIINSSKVFYKYNLYTDLFKLYNKVIDILHYIV